MALWGVSGSDLKTFGFNTAVCAGGFVSCMAVAWGVKKLVMVGFALAAARAKTIAISEKDNKTEKISSALGVAAGFGAAFLVYKFLPARFALITDDSNSKALKIGALQAVVGALFDYLTANRFSAGTLIAASGAIGTRFGADVLPLASAFGAVVGAGYCSSTPDRKATI